MALKRLRLIQRRKALGFTQESLAEQVGCERTTVIRWERAETEPQPWVRPRLTQVAPAHPGGTERAAGRRLGRARRARRLHPGHVRPAGLLAVSRLYGADHGRLLRARHRQQARGPGRPRGHHRRGAAAPGAPVGRLARPAARKPARRRRRRGRRAGAGRHPVPPLGRLRRRRPAPQGRRRPAQRRRRKPQRPPPARDQPAACSRSPPNSPSFPAGWPTTRDCTGSPSGTTCSPCTPAAKAPAPTSGPRSSAT